MIDQRLKPYLAYSAGGHALLVLAVVWLAARGGLTKHDKVYRIDFIGSTPGILNRSKDAPAVVTEKAPPQAAKPAPQTDPDEFRLRRSGKPLPKPSMLETGTETAAKKAVPAAVAAAPGGGGGGPADISTDMTDFPYPWYITRLRALLWDRWSARMPPGQAECGVMFTVLRNGRTVDLRVESTSGDAGYDYAALSAVQEAGPFPPLPAGFEESFLKVHVRFRSTQ